MLYFCSSKTRGSNLIANSIVKSTAFPTRSLWLAKSMVPQIFKLHLLHRHKTRKELSFQYGNNGSFFKNKFITLSISIPVTETVNLRLLLSIPVIVVKDLTSKIARIHDFSAVSFPHTQLQIKNSKSEKTIVNYTYFSYQIIICISLRAACNCFQ